MTSIARPPLGIDRALGRSAARAWPAAASRAPPPPPPPPAPPPTPAAVEPVAAGHRAAPRPIAAYMARAAPIIADFTERRRCRRGAEAGASLRAAGQLLRGAIAYGAVVALQDPNFVAGVRAYRRRRRAAPAWSPTRSCRTPPTCVGFAGADSAAGLVIAALTATGPQAATTAGAAVKQAAYDVQHQAWSKDDRARPRRAAGARPSSSRPSPCTGDGPRTARLQQAAAGLEPAGADRRRPPAPPYTAAGDPRPGRGGPGRRWARPATTTSTADRAAADRPDQRPPA